MLQFIHITDCHISTEIDTWGFDSKKSFFRVIEHIKNLSITFDFILVTGDIAQGGSIDGYAIFSDAMESLNIPVYCVAGNHDQTEILKNHFPKTPNQAISVNLIKNHLLILLNTKDPEQQSGFVSNNQLQQLENILTTNRNRPVIVAMHHHPISIHSQWLDNIKLRNGSTLLTLLEKFKEIKIAMFGHIHQEIDTEYKHIQLIASPSTCYQFKAYADNYTRDELSPGYRTIKLHHNIIDTQVYRIK